MNDRVIDINCSEIYKTITYKHFLIFYENEEAAINTFNEVFGNKYYFLNLDKKAPLIIDCGANIGLATIFFKDLYPQARIICFEPDPNAFQLLKKNIEFNAITNVTLINAALAREEGVTNFYGQVQISQPDSRGNSILREWGTQRDISNIIQVKTVKLSNYINEPVDLLKIDIEGAEQQVLEEIIDKLKLVNNIVIEVHEANDIKASNSLGKILDILSEQRFKFECISKNISEILPEQVKGWAKKAQPQLYELKASKIEDIASK